jgi:hypothetical protein
VLVYKMKMVGPGGVSSVNNLNAVDCPTGTNPPYTPKTYSRQLSNPQAAEDVI